MTAVLKLIDDGYADRLLFSHDVCMKIQRREYGGFGYSHLPENILPTLEERGVSKDTLDQITVENPQTILTFDSPDN
jgi:phosphotriesterase-related protein